MLRQGYVDFWKFKVSLVYIVQDQSYIRPYPKNKKKKRKNKEENYFYDILTFRIQY